MLYHKLPLHHITVQHCADGFTVCSLCLRGGKMLSSQEICVLIMSLWICYLVK